MLRPHASYAPEYQRQMVDLVRAGRTPGELAREFECFASAIRNWVRQANRDEGRREDGLTSLELEELRRLEGEDPVLEWVKATGLRPILNGLGDADRECFVEVYRERLRQAYPRRSGGHVLYPFRRLFMVATRRG